MWQALWQAFRSLPLIDGKGLASFKVSCLEACHVNDRYRDC